MIWIGIGLFFSLHLIPSFPNVRTQLISRFGEKGYRGGYSLLSLIGLILIVAGYIGMEYEEVWLPPYWAPQAALIVMPIVIILLVAADQKGHIRKKLKHPMSIGVVLWALVHLLNRGDLAALLLFGCFGLFGLFSIFSANRRGKLPDYDAPQAKHDVRAIVIGLVISAVLVFWGHEFLFGVQPPY